MDFRFSLSLHMSSLGIYKKYNYRRCHYEYPPYNENTKRSVYHVREVEVFRLKQLTGKIDVFLSHDWPMNIDKFGDEMTATTLATINPNFQSDIENDRLGSPANKELLEHLKPAYWFSGHLHCRFSAVVPHKNDDSQTKFLALDRATNDEFERKFIEVIDIDVEPEECPLSYDLEYLTILHLTQHLITGKKSFNSMPVKNGTGRLNFTPTDDEKDVVLSKFDNDLTVPLNFCRTCGTGKLGKSNPQTAKLCSTLDIQDPLQVAMIAANKVNKK